MLLKSCFGWVFSQRGVLSMILYPQTCWHIIGGLPLAIEVTASYLYENKGKIQIWRETLDRLRKGS